MIKSTCLRIFSAGFAVLWLAICWPGVGLAATVSNLYEAEVDAFGQSESARNKAFAVALLDVLIKVTGHSDLASQPEAQNLMANAATLVQQYRYRELEKKQGAPILGGDFDVIKPSDAAPSHRLWVQFAPEALRRELTQLGLIAWHADRPETLVWLAIRLPRNSYLLGANSEDGLKDRIAELAAQRGVPMLLPLMDYEDTAKLRVMDVQTDASSEVLAASERYGVESVLTGQLQPDGKGGWTAVWTAYYQGQITHWQTSGLDLDASLLGGLGGVAENLAVAAARVEAGPDLGAVELLVDSVGSTADYARVSSYLSGLSQVTALQLSQVTASQLRFVLHLRGNLSEFERQLARGGVLVPAVVAGFNERSLQYTYLH